MTDNNKKNTWMIKAANAYVKISLLFTTIVVLAAAVKVLRFVSQFIFNFLDLIFKVN